jgi:hypothetical protein
MDGQMDELKDQIMTLDRMLNNMSIMKLNSDEREKDDLFVFLIGILKTTNNILYDWLKKQEKRQ